MLLEAPPERHGGNCPPPASSSSDRLPHSWKPQPKAPLLIRSKGELSWLPPAEHPVPRGGWLGGLGSPRAAQGGKAHGLPPASGTPRQTSCGPGRPTPTYHYTGEQEKAALLLDGTHPESPRGPQGLWHSPSGMFCSCPERLHSAPGLEGPAGWPTGQGEGRGRDGQRRSQPAGAAANSEQRHLPRSSEAAKFTSFSPPLRTMPRSLMAPHKCAGSCGRPSQRLTAAGPGQGPDESQRRKASPSPPRQGVSQWLLEVATASGVSSAELGADGAADKHYAGAHSWPAASGALLIEPRGWGGGLWPSQAPLFHLRQRETSLRSAEQATRERSFAARKTASLFRALDA